MAKNKFISFINRHLIISNLIIIIAITILVGWLTIVWFNHYTRHGDDLYVPNVEGMSLEKAKELLQSEGFNVVVDSMYLLSSKPGIIKEQSPGANALVKRGKTIRIKYVCYMPKMAIIPVNFMNYSARAAIDELKSLGMDVIIEYVPASENGILISATYNGQPIHGGQEIPMGSEVIVTVGENQKQGIAPTVSNQTKATPVQKSGDNIYYEESSDDELIIEDLPEDKPKPSIAPIPSLTPEPITPPAPVPSGE